MPLNYNDFFLDFISTLKSYISNDIPLSSLLSSQHRLFVFRNFSDELEEELKNKIFILVKKLNFKLLHLNKLSKEYRSIDKEIMIDGITEDELIRYAITLGKTSSSKHPTHTIKLPPYPTKEMVNEELKMEIIEEEEKEEEEIVSFDF